LRPSSAHTRAVYEGIRRITQTYAPGLGMVRDENGRILTEPTEVRERRKRYFDKLYNDPCEADEEYLENIDERKNFEAIPDLGEDEVEAAIRRLEAEKSSGTRQHHSRGTTSENEWSRSKGHA